MMIMVDSTEIGNYSAGQLIAFQNPDNSTDPNINTNITA